MSQSTMAGLSLETVIYEKKDAIAYLTVNRPKVLNALNHRTWADLGSAFAEARADAEVRGIILTGSRAIRRSSLERTSANSPRSLLPSMRNDRAASDKAS